VQPLIILSENIMAWFKSQEVYTYFNWYLAQPSADYTGVMIVLGVIVVAILIIVVCK
jgi:hypothetical protein